MDTIETRLGALALRQPPEGLRERVLSAVPPAPSEWGRLLHTLEACAAALLVVAGWSLWYESGSESLRQACRTTPPDAYRQAIEERLMAHAEENPVAYEYAVARLMEAYTQSYVVRPES